MNLTIKKYINKKAHLAPKFDHVPSYNGKENNI